MDTRPGFSAGRNVRNSLENRMDCVGEDTSLNIIPVAQALTNINAEKLFGGNHNLQKFGDNISVKF